MNQLVEKLFDMDPGEQFGSKNFWKWVRGFRDAASAFRYRYPLCFFLKRFKVFVGFILYGLGKLKMLLWFHLLDVRRNKNKIHKWNMEEKSYYTNSHSYYQAIYKNFGYNLRFLVVNFCMV